MMTFRSNKTGKTPGAVQSPPRSPAVALSSGSDIIFDRELTMDPLQIWTAGCGQRRGLS